MNAYTLQSLDDACAALRALAKREGVECIGVHVRQDGRVRIYAETDGLTHWAVEADVEPGGALEFPSAAVCARAAETGAATGRSR